MIEEIPECELGVHNIDKPENRKIFTKYGYDVLKVRPCETYMEEYKDCNNLKTKFRDLYVLGHGSDCRQWYTDYKNCMEFRKNKKIDQFETVLNSEKKRVEIRTRESKKNDVWKYRTEPPKDFEIIDLEQVPRSGTYSPFDVYENIKAKRRKQTEKEEEEDKPLI